MEQDKIINKIRKVLALTKSNYQEEAQAALLKAQELMAQHGITMSEIEISSKEVDLEKQVVDTCVSESRRNTWYEKNLSSIIGKNFRCHPYVTGGKGIYFIGLKEDVEIAKEIYLYALTTMLYLATNYVKENRNKIIRITSKQLKNDYMIGFLNGLKKRFEEQVESKGYALILAKDALVVQAVEEKNLIKKKGSKIVIAGSLDARQTGYRDGRNFNENKKMIR
ncbi:hypothetical protein Desru_0699 [Desulforamulus ruminis DSM 2154]|uniref:Uncharacterized protein n=1 Tax=Desulforamulus ruminis (strain ATCC 23193 / DSM 2154 / NCIMB 8452 / DL) TaxID=696281 RepID=F6DTW5_DESRL|nr:hypothetical protein Desru_0699 [Desulforamulus ruminis DSM 2154]